MRNVLEALSLKTPIVQAPMGGGFTTPELVAAVCNAGGLGSVGSPYFLPEQIVEAAAAVRKLTDKPFGMNLFLFEQPAATTEEIERTIALLTPYCRELGIDPPAVTGPFHPDIEAQIEAVLASRPAVFSFTLGMPKPAVIAECRRLGILTVGTATTLAEGEALAALGVDAVCAQGGEAGGHRGAFLGDYREGMVGVVALTTMLKARLSVPVIAAGGIMNGRAARALIAAGASAVQLGTAFLTCPEAGTPATHKAALTSPMNRRTRVSAAYSGAPARGMVNRYMEEMDGVAMAPFPATNSLTRGIRAAANKQGRPEFMSLWAGQAAPLIRTMPAADLVNTIAAEMEG